LTSFGTVTLNSHIMQTASLPLTVLRGFEMAQLSNKGTVHANWVAGCLGACSTA
jgi:hypothetical protein